MTKKWHILSKYDEDIIPVLLKNRGVDNQFLHPKNPFEFTAKDVGVDPQALKKAIARIRKAVKNKESIIVYADYDADGICAGAIMWETIHAIGGNVMPYIPHRVEDGYGLSVKGIDAVRELYDPSLIITVDHGITAREKIAYAKSLGIEVIVTDHHVKPSKLPDCTIVHTTKLSGVGVSWFVASSLSRGNDTLELAAIGTIADMVSLTGANRPIVKFGLQELNRTKRVGLLALIKDAGLTLGELSPYDISHVLAPRLNAMGRLVHAMDALRLLCTHQEDKARLLAEKLGLTNKERQQLTIDTTTHALRGLSLKTYKKLLFVAHETYNPGVIGLVAGKLVEEYYRPAVVVARGPEVSKGSARSIAGFNIVEAIKRFSGLLVDVGGHPMAAGFTVETKNLDKFQRKLESFVERQLPNELLTRQLRIDMELPLSAVTGELWRKLRDFEPFGFGNPEPVFSTPGVEIKDVRLVGADGKHLKLRIGPFEAIAFGMGNMYPKLKSGAVIDIAYTVDMNVWNGNKKLQLKLKDIRFSTDGPLQ
jgi:single-stranded-DNA-specific exonuclease